MGMQPEELRALIEARDRCAPCARFVVVDLRKSDYSGGHVKGSMQVPSMEVIGNTDKIIKQLENYDLVIFHCMISMHRAPQCAQYYKSRLHALGRNQAVVILEGGYSRWREMFSRNPALIEDE